MSRTERESPLAGKWFMKILSWTNSYQRDRASFQLCSSIHFGYNGCPGVKQKISELSSMGLLWATTQCTINNVLHFLSPITQVFQMFCN